MATCEQDEELLLATIGTVLAATSAILSNNEVPQQHVRRFWVRPSWRYRELEGQAHSLLPRLRARDEEYYRDFLRMPPRTFDTLLDRVKSSIERKDTNWRRAIPADARLGLTLRFLANGDTMRSSSYNFLVGRSSAQRIIRETCEALWDCLHKEYLCFPSTSAEWTQIARDMEYRWNFPNCLGSIDGKHVQIECPANSGSQNFNYKRTFSIVLLAVCDAHYRFTYVDVGHHGGESDGGIFSRSELLKLLETGGCGIPSPAKVGTAGDIPYVIIGDEAFPLKEFLMGPYSKRGNLEHGHKVFNYRLSRARRVIENAFGIMASRWRILRRPFRASPDNVKGIVMACVALHNFLLKESEVSFENYIPPGFTDTEDWEGRVLPGSWRREEASISGIEDQRGIGYNCSRSAGKVRDRLAAYFLGEGAVPWQDKVVLRAGH